MRSLLRKAAIIGAGLLLALGLAGCSTLRLGYDNGPMLAWWWLDGYVDFDAEQAPRARQALAQWFTWHRQTQLEDYGALLAQAHAEVLEPTSPDRVCRWADRLRARARVAAEAALPLAAPLAAQLGEAQWRHLEQRFAKRNDELRRDFLQADPAERRVAAFERAVERAEDLYGRLDDAQRSLLAEAVAASPFDPEAWLGERQRRQRELLQVLRRIRAEGGDPDRTIAALRVLVLHVESSPQPDYRSYQERLTTYNCALVARLHNTTSAAQRERARRKFEGWQSDLRTLAAAMSTAAAPAR